MLSFVVALASREGAETGVAEAVVAEAAGEGAPLVLVAPLAGAVAALAVAAAGADICNAFCVSHCQAPTRTNT